MASTDPPPSAQPRRRFQPQPYETSTSHSGPARGNMGTPASAAMPASDPPATTPPDKGVKRFRAEPIETSTRSSRRNPAASDNASAASDRPPMALSETSAPSKPPQRRKFAVEPMETTTRSNKKPGENAGSSDTSSEDTSKKPARRKFKVELIETATRSRKVGDPAPADLLVDKKNRPTPSGRSSPTDGLLSPRPGQQRAASNPTIPLSVLLKPAPNRQGSMHPHYNTRAPSRAHSFRVPDLESIASSESDRSGTNSPSSTTNSHLDATRLRESVDDRFSGYLLALAARAAEKQLREQEAALYPSTDAHEQINHYVDSEESEEMDVEVVPLPVSDSASLKMKRGHRRDSDDDDALRQLQRHGEKIQKDQRGRLPTSMTGQRKKTGAFNVEFDSEAQQDAWVQPPAPKEIIGGHQKDPDLKQMRKAASPPMLGGDMEFPRCPSPEHARFDVTQGSEYLRNTMCYLSTQETGGDQRLWDGKSNRTQLQRSAATTGRVPQTAKESKKTAKPQGLWGGHCNLKDAKMFAAPIGLVTPKSSPSLERDDPFSQLMHVVSAPQAGSATAAALRSSRMPPSPPASNSSLSTSRDPNVDTKLADEFPDSFVTQVYNYLSLGFPALARKFDDELAKISGVPVVELRQDDKLAEQRGYIRLGEDEVGVEVSKADSVLAPSETGFDPEADGSSVGDEIEVHETMCRRWLALRLYVREWGRQMGVADPGGDRTKTDLRVSPWGLPARKGSWAN